MSVFDIFKKLDEQKAAQAAQPVEWLVVGLGNPGSKYDNTRHNAGFRALESYCARTGQKIDRMKFKALVGEGMLGGGRVLFLKPQTFMNLSGEAVRDAERRFTRSRPSGSSCCRTISRSTWVRCACARKARRAARTG